MEMVHLMARQRQLHDPLCFFFYQSSSITSCTHNTIILKRRVMVMAGWVSKARLFKGILDAE